MTPSEPIEFLLKKQKIVFFNFTRQNKLWKETSKHFSTVQVVIDLQPWSGPTHQL